MDSVFTEIFTTLRDDNALKTLVGASGTALFHRSWPTETAGTSATDPAFIIVSFEGLGGKEGGDGQADTNFRAEIHIFVRHEGFGQSHLMSIRDRIDALLNLKSFVTATKRLDNLHTTGENLDLYDTDTETHHGVLFYGADRIYPV